MANVKVDIKPIDYSKLFIGKNAFEVLQGKCCLNMKSFLER